MQVVKHFVIPPGRRSIVKSGGEANNYRDSGFAAVDWVTASLQNDDTFILGPEDSLIEIRGKFRDN